MARGNLLIAPAGQCKHEPFDNRVARDILEQSVPQSTRMQGIGVSANLPSDQVNYLAHLLGMDAAGFLFFFRSHGNDHLQY